MFSSFYSKPTTCSRSDSRIMLMMLLTEAMRFHHTSSEMTSSADDWQQLKKQVAAAWDTSSGTAEEKYTRIKIQLTGLFLWDTHNVVQRDLDAPPLAAIQEFHRRQRKRLTLIPSGELFMPCEVPSSPPPRSPPSACSSDTASNGEEGRMTG